MTDTNTTPRPQAWLDLKVPLWGIVSVFLALAGQSATLLIWGTNLTTQTAANTASIADLQVKAANVASLRETVARIDERTQAMVVTVNHLDAERSGGGN